MMTAMRVLMIKVMKGSVSNSIRMIILTKMIISTVITTINMI